MTAPLVVWRICDGKSGHDRQTAGLVAALRAELPVAEHVIEAAAVARAPWLALRRRFPAGAGLPDPALIVGAGRRTQWPLIAARRARGGKSVYLMRPSLPARCFDLCLVPRHDGATVGPHVEPTTGVLNDLRPAAATRGTTTLVLVGGPSRHHGWDERKLLAQIASIVYGTEPREIVITDSRRTPAATSASLGRFEGPGVRVLGHRATPPGWLAAELPRARAAWVTTDSVSMMFEAWTAGVPLGLIEVPARRDDRISRLAGEMVAAGAATRLDAWLAGRALGAPPRLAEAERCARLIARRWFMHKPAVAGAADCVT